MPTPEEGGDGKARERVVTGVSGMRSETGTMTTKEEALQEKKSAALTTV